MRHLAPIARVVLGLIFVVFSANYFLHFLPEPKGVPAGAVAFASAFTAAGLMTFVKLVELAAGLALLANRAVPLALTLLAPIVVGITFFHAAFAPSGLALAVVLVGLELGLAYAHRAAFAPLLRWRSAPAPAPRATPAIAARA